MIRPILGVAVWRWSAVLMGLISLAAAVVLSWWGASAWGDCLTGAHRASLGHCPLCWVAVAALLAAAVPEPRQVGAVLVRARNRRR
jgi:hypothetical protein